MHGDLLCTDDLNYQKFREQISKPWIQSLFLFLPLFVRRYLAKWGRQKSQVYTQTADRKIQDVVQETVESYMKQFNCTLLIHGHTHLPAIHDFILDNKNVQRIVLSAWHSQGFALCYQSDGQVYSLNIAQ
jgi:UDP-2,3-diacylglucosamine hydrolase